MAEVKFKQWKISDLIKNLKELKKDFGDLPISQSADKEGNAFSIVGEFHGKDGEKTWHGCSLGIDNAEKPTELTLWPINMTHSDY